MLERMRAAVIIPTYQRGHMLADALASLDAQDEPCEVYVYDDGRNIARWRGTDDEVRQAERRVYRRLVREIREEHGYG